MTPLDFVVFDGGSSPNTPCRDIAMALETSLKVVSRTRGPGILSYFYDEEDKCFILEIEEN